MKLSLKWLSEFMMIDFDEKTYASQMTMSGSKVETVSYTGEGIKNVVVGQVIEINRHENSDHLFVCQVDAGQGRLQTIVTGAQNVSKGDFVPVALDGSVLPGGKEIRAGVLRGVMSEGMLCSVSELGLTVNDVPYAIEDGILILKERCMAGQDIRTVLGLDDVVIDFEITSNRPDCLSIRGLARESAATFGRVIQLPEPEVKAGVGEINDLLSVEVKDAVLCPRYTARMVRDVRIGPSPNWMRERLRSCGVRPINNIVDITNYVMLEYGQPMHAFDYSCVLGGKIVVRRAADGETLETLDGQHRPLKPSMLVIADEDHPVGVAGVMGGANSEITEKTRMVVFESANFNGVSIRQTASGLGMRTDASSRFEKGLDPENTIPAVNRACELVELLECGEVLDGIIDINNTDYSPRVLPFEPEKLRRHIGAKIEDEDMRGYLTLLGFEVKDGGVTVPSWRADVEVMADLAEEVARFYGYDKIPTTMFKGPILKGGYTEKQKAERRASELCRGLGYSEIMTYSFISPSCYDKIGLEQDSGFRKSLSIINPLGEDTSVMRTTALPSMLETIARNQNSRNPSARLFELAAVYLPGGDKLPEERQKLMLGAYGDVDFFDIKGDAEALLSGMGVPGVAFMPCSDNLSYHPGRCALIKAGEKELGVIGQIHPTVLSNYDISDSVYVLEADFTLLLDLRAPEKVYKPLARFPAVTNDIAVVCDKEIPVADLIGAIREGAGDLLENVELFDVYTGSQVQAGKKSAAFSLTLRSADRTLLDSEAEAAVKGALKLLESRFGAVLRA